VDIQEVADRSRLYIDRLVMSKASGEDLAAVAALLDQATAILDAAVPDEPRNMYEGFAATGDYLDLFRLNPVIGKLNPVAPRFDIERREGVGDGYQGKEIEARTELGILYEGPIGMVHGGIIASLFDQFLAIANIHCGLGAFTGSLTITYRQPCPLEVPLRFVCRTDRVDGRKVYTSGELFAGETLVAEGSGIFILPSEARMAELIGERDAISATFEASAFD
jgi:acyl-coenzyme A thioesterase PaaI-like protein